MTLPDWPLSALATAWCAFALFAGYAVRGAAGFGSGVVMTPLMAFVLPLSTVAPLVTFLGLFVSLRQMWIDRPLVAWNHLAAFIPGILVGVRGPRGGFIRTNERIGVENYAEVIRFFHRLISVSAMEGK